MTVGELSITHENNRAQALLSIFSKSRLITIITAQNDVHRMPRNPYPQICNLTS